MGLRRLKLLDNFTDCGYNKNTGRCALLTHISLRCPPRRLPQSNQVHVLKSITPESSEPSARDRRLTFSCFWKLCSYGWQWPVQECCKCCQQHSKCPYRLPPGIRFPRGCDISPSFPLPRVVRQPSFYRQPSLCHKTTENGGLSHFPLYREIGALSISENSEPSAAADGSFFAYRLSSASRKIGIWSSVGGDPCLPL